MGLDLKKRHMNTDVFPIVKEEIIYQIHSSGRSLLFMNAVQCVRHLFCVAAWFCQHL